MTGFTYNDGGRAAAGYKGNAGDCVTRAVTIASGLPYQKVYAALSAGSKTQRKTKHGGPHSSARDGVDVKRKWFKDYMASIGFRWVPTMAIGSGTTVHLNADELPSGRLVVAVSRHYTAMIDGIIHDMHDPRRGKHWTFEPDTGQELKPNQGRNVNGVWTEIGGRAVYGYWMKEEE